jgi:hypothetical protein
MKIERFLVGLTATNLVLLVVLLLSFTNSALANPGPQVLRGRGLEIVDDRGRVRASIKVQPAEIFKPTGKHYAENVVLRLIDQNGRPEVKIVASVDGGGLSLVGEADATQLLLKADSGGSAVTLKNKTGRQRLIEP